MCLLVSGALVGLGHRLSLSLFAQDSAAIRRFSRLKGVQMEMNLEQTVGHFLTRQLNLAQYLFKM